MTVVAERRNLHRELLLSAAEREFARTGYAETKVAAISKAAGLSLATLYKTFPGKTEIWNELHTERMDALLTYVAERVGASTSPLERLLSGIAAVATFLAEHDAYLQLNLAAGPGWVAAGGTTGPQHTVWSAGLDMLAAGAEASRAAGELADLRPRIAAGMIVSALQVWLADWVATDRDRDPADLVADLVHHLRVLLTRPPAEAAAPPTA